MSHGTCCDADSCASWGDTYRNESRHTLDWVMEHVAMSHDTHYDADSCASWSDTHGIESRHTGMSHDTHCDANSCAFWSDTSKNEKIVDNDSISDVTFAKWWDFRYICTRIPICYIRNSDIRSLLSPSSSVCGIELSNGTRWHESWHTLRCEFVCIPRRHI